MKLFSYKQAQGFATFSRVRFREGAHLSSYNNSKIEFVGWYGGNGNITDSAGEARLVIRGLETGNSDLTVKQKAEIFQSSGLSHKEEIQVVDPAP